MIVDTEALIYSDLLVGLETWVLESVNRKFSKYSGRDLFLPVNVEIFRLKV